VATASPPAPPLERLFTILLYLNPDWEPSHGGCLRVYYAAPLPAAEEQHHDVAPQAGRLLVFRSGDVEHEVLAAHADRWAITMWVYGTYAPGSPAERLARSHVRKEVIPAGRPLVPPGAAAFIDPPPTPLAAAPPTVPITAEPERDDILVVIPAYRDAETMFTVADLFWKAANPRKVHVSVCLQYIHAHMCAAEVAVTGSHPAAPSHDPADDLSPSWQALCALLDQLDAQVPAPSPTPALRSHVHISTLDARDAAGPAWARHVAFGAYRGHG